jgi:hypothetical protein
MANTAELEAVARRCLENSLADAKRGADPRRVYHGGQFTRPIGQSREQIRGRAGRDYEEWRLAYADGSAGYGTSVLIVETLNSGETCVDAEAFDHDSGTSIWISQPVKRSLGRWKARGPSVVNGPAEPLPVAITGSAIRYDLEPLPLEERRRLTGIIETRNLPHILNYAAIFIAAEAKDQVTSIEGWPDEAVVPALEIPPR